MFASVLSSPIRCHICDEMGYTVDHDGRGWCAEDMTKVLTDYVVPEEMQQDIDDKAIVKQLTCEHPEDERTHKPVCDSCGVVMNPFQPRKPKVMSPAQLTAQKQLLEAGI